MARVSNVKLLSGHFPVALETGVAMEYINSNGQAGCCSMEE